MDPFWLLDGATMVEFIRTELHSGCQVSMVRTKRTLYYMIKDTSTYWSKTMTSWCFVKSRARRTAKSLASDPELQKRIVSRPVPETVLRISSAHSVKRELTKRTLQVEVATWLQMDWTTVGWQCPTKLLKCGSQKGDQSVPCWTLLMQSMNLRSDSS